MSDEGYFPASAEPLGNVHWAGSETASEHAGYIEGAIESGERVACELAEMLSTATVNGDTTSSPTRS
ncbi:FAD-dependent oxidoreductase [Nocardia sp. CA-151230]|uniref:FAD-dependent oxidoreductase n=1 Tax=Nocardia sp. CA-151230 TaxID=3239982 RepID=UPI003D92B7A9